MFAKKLPINPMHLLSRFLLFAAIFATTSLSLRVQAADTISIDLIKAQINGQDLFALSMDKATDLLGNPDRIYKEERFTALVYVEQGVRIDFKESSGELMCSGLQLFLTQQDLKGDLIQFRGRLTKGLDKSWKVKRFLEEFGELKPKDMATDEGAKLEHLKTLALVEKMRKEMREAPVFLNREHFERRFEERVKQSTKFLYRIQTTKPNLALMYDQDLKFIHTITIEK